MALVYRLIVDESAVGGAKVSHQYRIIRQDNLTVKTGDCGVVNAIIIGWIAPQSVEAWFEFELPWMRQACQYEFVHKRQRARLADGQFTARLPRCRTDYRRSNRFSDTAQTG